MGKIIISQQLREQFKQTKEPVELVDEHGEFLGRFTPPFDESQVEYLLPPPTEEEVEERLQSGGPYLSFDELMARLDRF